jgi:hypothetical protein
MRFVCSGLVALLIGAAGCGGGKLINQRDASGAGGIGGFGRTYEKNVSRAVDILFLIDDSDELLTAQQKLLVDFQSLITTLQSGPGGMPDLHIGVISPDMGAGDGTIPGCNASGGKNGILQHPTRGILPCAGTLQAGATYISKSGEVANYTGEIAEVFKCIGGLGESGCGFEHPFAAILRALGADGRPAPADNAGFLRPDASLAIVMLTNEDDCSASPGSGPNGRIPLFDMASNFYLQSQLGPPAGFRCNEFGHICDGMHPSRSAPNNDVTAKVTYRVCRSNDAEGYLLGVVDTANRIKALKADPAKILVASISGPAAPYEVHWRPPSSADTSCGAASCPWPEISHSCTGAGLYPTVGDPGVRITELINEFGARGLPLSICEDTFVPAMQALGAAVGALVEPACITAPVEDDPSKPGLQPSCSVTGHAQANGTLVHTIVPSCEESPPPCWTFATGLPACNGGTSVVYNPGSDASSATSFTVKCSLCLPGEFDPSRCL